ncbi:MTAP family purine nucleoside phosphorylase [Candidatus Woesearchaeota archaeon]|nr:MTAP family purine nucleoside phosphorylase [Candidatus Woesearchaeota archaeon]
MGEIAVIGGSGFKDFGKQGAVFLQRHGEGIPPHKIDHKANLLSLKEKGVDKVIGVCSVGSLKLDIPPGSIVIPHDYINLTNMQTYNDLEAVHITPSLDEELRNKIIEAAKKGISIVNKGVYIQTTGPRLETKAEINMIKNYADIVGMTMANEATLAKELGMKYAAICSVDNFANGLTDEEISIENVNKNQEKNKEKILKLLEAVL